MKVDSTKLYKSANYENSSSNQKEGIPPKMVCHTLHMCMSRTAYKI